MVMHTDPKENKGKMTVAEAGRKGGRTTADTHGPEFYSQIGQKGGEKVKRLVEKGKRAEGGSPSLAM